MIALIVATTKNLVIGKNNQLPWPRKYSDLSYFKKQTLNHTIIMGRKTYESMGKEPLLYRNNIVVTKNRNYKLNFTNQGTVNLCHDPALLIKTYLHCPELVFVIGGSLIYQYFYNVAQYLYVTVMNEEFSGDSYFVDYQKDNFWNLIYDQDAKYYHCYIYEKEEK